MKYIKGYGYYIGKFDEHDLNNGVDKTEVEKAKKETGLQYTNQKVIYKNKKPIGIELYVCDINDLRI